MHGRVKVKTTAEQEAEKAKEREKKMKIYQTAVKRVMLKRKNREFDDEALELTSKILGPNPDFYSMWNFRKEILLLKKTEGLQEDFQKLCIEELHFLQTCLHTNPKSYSIWLHRQFVMTTMPLPDWSNELKLCTLFLSYDERNFHCWDYRRFIISNTQVSPQEEFQYTSKKILDNFSNYSAWHNRSMLLPQIHPHKDNPKEVDTLALGKEFELAQNAFFTDPYDQSAWFYHRWLLGRERKKCDLIHLSVDYLETKMEVTASFSDPIQLTENASCLLTLNDAKCDGCWRSGCPFPGHSYIWIFSGTVKKRNIDEDVKIRLRLANPELEREIMLKKGVGRSVYDWSSASNSVSFIRNELPSADPSVLEAELESCRLLLEEEQGNKWTLLTIVFLMRALDFAKYKEEIELHLTELCTVDPYRKGYYEDLRSKFRIEYKLEEIRKEKGNLIDVDLSGQGLKSMYYHQFLTSCKVLRLAKNNLRQLGQVYLLPNLETLNLDYNNLSNVSTFLCLAQLKELSLRNNTIAAVDDLSPLAKLDNLRTLTLEGNPICSEENYRVSVRNIVPQLTMLDGISY